MKCLACDNLMTNKEIMINDDYCHKCLLVITEDLIEFDRIKSKRESNE